MRHLSTIVLVLVCLSCSLTGCGVDAPGDDFPPDGPESPGDAQNDAVNELDASGERPRSCDELGCDALTVSRICVSSGGEDCSCSTGTKDDPMTVACHPSCRHCETEPTCVGHECRCERADGSPLRCTDDGL